MSKNKATARYEIFKAIQSIFDNNIKIKEYIKFQKSVTNKLLTYTTSWMNRKSLILSERNPTQKPTYCMIPFL